MIQALIQFILVLTLLMAPAFSVFASEASFGSTPGLQEVLPWLDETTFVQCGMSCKYRKAIESHSQKALFLVRRMENLERSVRRGALSPVLRNISGYCTQNEIHAMREADSEKRALQCFDRFKTAQRFELRKIRGEMAEYGRVIDQLEGISTANGGQEIRAIAPSRPPGTSGQERKRISQTSYFVRADDLAVLDQRRGGDRAISLEYEEWLEGFKGTLPTADEYAQFIKVGNNENQERVVWLSQGEDPRNPTIRERQKDLREYREIHAELGTELTTLRKQVPSPSRPFDRNEDGQWKQDFGDETVTAFEESRDELVGVASGDRRTGLHFKQESRPFRQRTISSVIPGKQVAPGVRTLELGSSQVRNNRRGKAKVHLPVPGDQGTFTILSPNDLNSVIEKSF